MTDRIHTIRVVYELLARNEPLVIASIVGVVGSSPRHVGSKMVVDSAGQGHGTIGGSLLEAAVIQEAASALKNRESHCMSFHKITADSNADAEGMLCGGTTKILLEYVAPSEANRAHFRALLERMAQGVTHAELTLLHRADKCRADTPVRPMHDIEEKFSKIERGIATPEGEIIGAIQLSAEEIADLTARLQRSTHAIWVQRNDSRLLIEPFNPMITLYCMGAGHVTKPTAQLASSTGFRVVVVDDRAEFANAERFPQADQVAVVDDFARAFEGFTIDRNAFIAIFTRGHQFDRMVLEQALRTDAAYIGLMSSQRKRAAIFESLLQSGFSPADLSRVHCPIGIKTKAETPEELAVSIVAELIDQRGMVRAQPGPLRTLP